MLPADDVLSAVRRELAELRKLVEARSPTAGLTGPLTHTLEGAARALGVSVRTVRRMVARGELLTVAIGARPMVPTSELHRIATPADAGSRLGFRFPQTATKAERQVVAPAALSRRPDAGSATASLELSRLRVLRQARRPA